MKSLVVICFAIAVAGTVLALCSCRGSLQKKNSAADASSMLPEDIQVVIDVRRQDEYAAGHLQRALLISNTEIGARIAAEVPDKNTRIGLYCRSGNRAGMAKTELESLGYLHVQNLGSLESAAAFFHADIVR